MLITVEAARAVPPGLRGINGRIAGVGASLSTTTLKKKKESDGKAKKFE